MRAARGDGRYFAFACRAKQPLNIQTDPFSAGHVEGAVAVHKISLGVNVEKDHLSTSASLIVGESFEHFIITRCEKNENSKFNRTVPALRRVIARRRDHYLRASVNGEPRHARRQRGESD